MTTQPLPVLVTGAAGFVGVRLLRELSALGIEAAALVRPGGSELPSGVPNTALRSVDLRDGEAVRAAVADQRPSAIVNLARTGHGGDPDSQAADHVGTVANLIEAARECGVERLVQAGTYLEHEPHGPYAKAKAEATALVLGADGEQLRTCVLRPTSVYGPGDRAAALIPSAVRSALEGTPLPVTPPGIGRDWVHVDDVARAFALALSGGADGWAIDIGSGVVTSNEWIVALVERALGASVPRGAEIDARPWDSEGVPFPSEAAAELLGWRAETPVERGVAETVAALRAAPAVSP